MRYALYVRSTGEFIGHGSAPDSHDASLLETDDVAIITLDAEEAPPDGATEFLSDGQRVSRPRLPGFTNPYDLTALSAGTIVRVTDESDTVHEIADLSEALTLEGPQRYRIKVAPPFPHVPIDTTIEVP